MPTLDEATNEQLLADLELHLTEGADGDTSDDREAALVGAIESALELLERFGVSVEWRCEM